MHRLASPLAAHRAKSPRGLSCDPPAARGANCDRDKSNSAALLVINNFWLWVARTTHRARTHAPPPHVWPPLHSSIRVVRTAER